MENKINIVKFKIKYRSKHFNVVLYEHFAISFEKRTFTWFVVDFHLSCQVLCLVRFPGSSDPWIKKRSNQLLYDKMRVRNHIELAFASKTQKLLKLSIATCYVINLFIMKKIIIKYIHIKYHFFCKITLHLYLYKI